MFSGHKSIFIYYMSVFIKIRENKFSYRKEVYQIEN